MVSFFFWVFCTSLPNQVGHTWLKSQLHICNYDWAKIPFVDEGLDSKLQHYGPHKNSWKKSKTSHLDHNGNIEAGLSRGRFRTDGRTDNQTMAAGASVTWTHCSVIFEVTSGKTRCVHADATMRPCGHKRVRADAKK
jgi:hypothetical protein